MRRTRPLLAASALLLVLSGVLAAPASAQEEPEGSEGVETQTGGETEVGENDIADEETRHLGEELEHLLAENGAAHADAECAKILGEGGTVEDCQEAPNPLLPETNEIVWGTIGFAIVFFFLARMGYPAIKKAMDERTERIRSDLQAAESQRTEAETVLSEYRAQLADAKSEAGRIIEEARQAADAMKREQEARLQTELAEMRQRAVADVDAAKTQALADLRSEVASLAVGAAEVVVQRNLDHATQVQLIEDYINRVGSQG